MIDFEKSLVPTIAWDSKIFELMVGENWNQRFFLVVKKLLKLEKEEVPGSGNFVSFRLLGDYFDCFNETKEYLIFGNQKVNRSLGFGFFSMWFLVYIIF